MNEQSGKPPSDENQIIAERRAKLAARRDQGVAFPNDFRRQNLAAGIIEEYEKTDRDALDLQPEPVTAAGRIMTKRLHGKSSFATIQDMSGAIQIYLTDSDTGEEQHTAFKHYDIGDIIGVKGVPFKTRTGEVTVRVSDLRLLVKSLRPLPEKFHGLTDQELKYRQRYVDLIVNENSRSVFVQRSRIVQALRDFLLKESYLEVETPMMQPIPGGAAARPFVTHHNALDMDLYLRIAPELYLKRLVVGGFEKVFEINRNFRNEGISTRHNPEFTMLEFYAAYVNHDYLMDLIQVMLRDVAQTVLGTPIFSYEGRDIDFAKPFERLTIAGALKKHHPELTDEVLGDRAALIGQLEERRLSYRSADGIGGLQLTLFEHTTEQFLFEPTYIVDYPAETSPLARCSDKNPELTERFELYIAGREIANGFSELNDPEDQAERFREQARHKEAGDAEAMHYDADYIRALEYGLPPCAGAGIGIDRLVMLMTDRPSIRDVILFPQLRPE
jgi:lysyl-tRNA synthetase, class II